MLGSERDLNLRYLEGPEVPRCFFIFYVDGAAYSGPFFLFVVDRGVSYEGVGDPLLKALIVGLVPFIVLPTPCLENENSDDACNFFIDP